MTLAIAILRLFYCEDGLMGDDTRSYHLIEHINVMMTSIIGIIATH